MLINSWLQSPGAVSETIVKGKKQVNRSLSAQCTATFWDKKNFFAPVDKKLTKGTQ